MEGSLSDKKVVHTRKCLQSRNILSLMSYPVDSKQRVYLEKHLSECSQCNELYNNAKRDDELIEIAIPFRQASVETKEELHREIVDLIGNLDLKPSEKSVRIFQKIKEAVQLILRV